MSTKAFLFSGVRKPRGQIEINDNGITDVSGYAEAYVNVDTAPDLQSQTVSPETVDVTVYPDPGYDGLSDVTVNAVTSDIDPNISEENIKYGVTILGVTGTLEAGGDLPDYLVQDGDTVSTLYFNTELSDAFIKPFLASLSYGSPEPSTGVSYCYLGPGNLSAADLTGAGYTGEYALVWADINDPAVIYSTVASSAYGVFTAGWQMTSFSPAHPFTADLSYANRSILAVKDYVIAKQSVAFGSHGGSGGGKAHTFAVPVLNGSYTYNGAAQTPSFTGFYSDFMTRTGDTSATHAGGYSVTFSLTDTANCQWGDGTVTDKTVQWSISKAALATPVCTPSAFQFSPAGVTDSLTVSFSGDGAVSAVSGDPSLLTVSVSGRVVTATALSFSAPASTYVTLTVGEGTDYYAYQGVITVSAQIMSAATSVFRIRTEAANVSVPLAIKQSTQTGMTIDWGDGSAPETPTGSYNQSTAGGLNYNVVKTHTYAAAGTYDISLTPDQNVIWSPGRQYGSNNYYNVFNKDWQSILSAGTGEPANVKAVSFEGNLGLKNTGMCAFKSTSLTSFKVASGVFDFITYSSFENCTSLTTVELPVGVGTMESKTFAYCPNLTSFRIKAPVPPVIYSNTFEATNASCAIYVPASSVQDYKDAPYWAARSPYIRAES